MRCDFIDFRGETINIVLQDGEYWYKRGFRMWMIHANKYIATWQQEFEEDQQALR